MYLLGYDIGSSSVKVALVQADSGATIATVQYPPTEMAIKAAQPGWAEQDPDTWWECLCIATQELLSRTGVRPAAVQSIGIAYQMHGLVVVDEDNRPLRPAIIWCDSRAVETGNQAFDAIGHEHSLRRLLNAPGNFTASKLKWVQENEPGIYQRIHQFMLPGDYIAFRLTGEICTTPGGLSEAILWDFKNDETAGFALDYFGFGRELLPKLVPCFSVQGAVSKSAAEATGLAAGTPVTYRAGDQPNNALALNVLQPGEIAASGGTSGVLYGVVDQPLYDPLSRVNGFVHVNHTKTQPRIGILLCINGTGIQYSWLRQNVAAQGAGYADMERMAASVPVGAEGLCILPFGNGAERMFNNKNPGAQVCRLDFNRHKTAHLYRAALEGIAFAFVYGARIMQSLGVAISVVRVGNDNLFQSAVFSNTVATLLNCTLEMTESTGAVGAAKASGVAAGVYLSLEEALGTARTIKTYAPQAETAAYRQAYTAWETELEKFI